MSEFINIGSGWKSKSGKGIIVSVHKDKLKELETIEANEKGYLSFFVGEKQKQEANKPTHYIAVITTEKTSEVEDGKSDLPF